MLELSRQAGWNQTDQDLAILTSRHPDSNILAVSSDDDSIPVGSGLVINAGTALAWIGMILVDHRFRRQGIATALMKQCLFLAREKMKNSVVGLDATQDGLQVYKRLGFEASFRIWRCIVTANAQYNTTVKPKIATASDLSGCESFIKKTGLYSKMIAFNLIRQLHPDGLWVARDGAEVRGLVMSRPGRLKPFVGPLLADSENTAKSLLGHALAYWKNLGYSEIFIDIPENHLESASFVLGGQMLTSRCLIRMYELIAGKNSHKPADPVEATMDYMEQERKSLAYLFATGGPELS